MLKRLFNTNLRRYSTIPFDKKAFPFTRFEPCCPKVDSEAVENGFIPCQTHPMPVVLGKKIELHEDMTRPPTLRHIMPCIGNEALEWTRAKVESVPGIMQTIMTAENHWLKTHRDIERQQEPMVMYTVSETPSKNKDKPDIMLFPEFKLIPAVDPLTMDENSTLYNVLSHIWYDPTLPLPNVNKLQDIEADTIILVCAHARRDMRCGKLGPLIIDEFNRVIQQQGLSEKVKVWGTSHFGGHKFAGNIIIHQRGLGGHIYGNVRQCHVQAIMDRHVVHGNVIKELWRGQVTPPFAIE